jgi:hypothetical protein
VHGDYFDYSQLDFVNLSTKVKLLGPDRKEFWQTPYNHLQGKNPALPRGEAIRAGKKKDATLFIAKAKAKFGNRFDYSALGYVNFTTAVSIGCAEHGIFYQIPHVHLRSKGCSKCSKQAAGLRRAEKHGADFVSAARAAHGSRYDYKSSKYVNAKTPLTINCKKHGDFSQTPDAHINAGSGCPDCGLSQTNSSKGVDELSAFLNLEVVKEKRIPDSLGRVDLFLPDSKLAIEYHGLYWHSTGRLDKGRTQITSMHKMKRLACEAAGWRYIAIYEDEWLYRRALCESYLLNQLGLAERVHARKLTVQKVTAKRARTFYERHHFLGACRGAHMGLWEAGVLVACMTLGANTERRGTTNSQVLCLSRYATDGRCIVGGMSRLFKALLEAAGEISSVVSYIDLDKYQGKSYAMLGFTPVAEIEPDYWTIWPVKGRRAGERRHKTATKRSNLEKLPDFRAEESEFENTQRMGLFRIYHSGRRKVVLTPRPTRAFVG